MDCRVNSRDRSPGNDELERRSSLETGADSDYRGDDDSGNTGRDQTILNGRGPGFVGQETCDQGHRALSLESGLIYSRGAQVGLSESPQLSLSHRVQQKGRPGGGQR
jgi:hypothetical protein